MGKRWAWFLKGDALRTWQKRCLKKLLLYPVLCSALHFFFKEFESGKTGKEEDTEGFQERLERSSYPRGQEGDMKLCSRR